MGYIHQGMPPRVYNGVYVLRYASQGSRRVAYTPYTPGEAGGWHIHHYTLFGRMGGMLGVVPPAMVGGGMLGVVLPAMCGGEG